MRMTIVFVAATVLVTVACSSERSAPTPPARAAATPTAPLEIPPDGPDLFAFMKEKIPTLAAKVPCSCCPYSIGQCYDGACPSSCGPCNSIGRDAYTWHVQGVPDDAIVARVRLKYRISR